MPNPWLASNAGGGGVANATIAATSNFGKRCSTSFLVCRRRVSASWPAVYVRVAPTVHVSPGAHWKSISTRAKRLFSGDDSFESSSFDDSFESSSFDDSFESSSFDESSESSSF